MADQIDGLAGSPAQQAAAKAVARGFRDRVKKLVDSSGDRSQLFEALRGYQQNMDVEQLVSTLSVVLNHPDRLPLFHDIRLMIPPRQHLAYNRMVPPPPSNSMRVVTLKKHGKDGFGFSVRGGKEYNCGMYISSVKAGSVAGSAELKVGEQLVSVDGYPVSELIHEEVLNLLRGARSLRLRLKAVCMLPYQNDGDDSLYWQLIGADGNPHETRDQTINEEDEETRALGALAPGERRVTITKDGQSLGCGIVGGSQLRKGIFVAAVQEGGLAYNSGLKNNDQMTSVNGFSFLDIKHSEAVRLLKSSNVLVVTVKSEKDREQQENWEKQMEQLQEERLLEFAQARPSGEDRTFYISPVVKSNPLEAEANTPNPYAEGIANDDLGELDVYSTDEILSDDASEEEDVSHNKQSSSGGDVLLPPEAGGDDAAVTNVVQSHLQRLYIEQQRERHSRMHKSSAPRLQLLQAVRGLRKTSTEAKKTTDSQSVEVTSASATTTVTTELSSATGTTESATVTTELSSSVTKSVKATKEQAIYEEAKIVTLPKSYIAEKSSTFVRTGAVVEATELSKAIPQGNVAADDSQAPAVPAAFADHDDGGVQGPDLPPRNTGPGSVNTAGRSPLYSTVDKNRKKKKQDGAEQKDNPAAKTTDKTSRETIADKRADGVHSSSGGVAGGGDKVIPNNSESLPQITQATSSRVSAADASDSKPQRVGYTQVEVTASSSRPLLKEKPVPSPKPAKKVLLTDSSAPSKVPYSAVKVVAREETARHSPPPLGTVLPKASALKGSQKKESTSASVEKSKPRTKKQAVFAADVECVVIKPPENKHQSMSFDELDDVNPSNLEFGEDVLQGRTAVFHSIPKNGPLGMKLRGGTGTSTGGRIFIAGINEAGAVGRYGKLHIGDQILMVDGTSFIDIGQKQATQSLHEAMQWETECIDVVIATDYEVAAVQPQ